MLNRIRTGLALGIVISPFFGLGSVEYIGYRESIRIEVPDSYQTEKKEESFPDYPYSNPLEIEGFHLLPNCPENLTLIEKNVVKVA